MKCPVCTHPDLVMSERRGIEIDYCPNCRGVWLDRGELDKLIDRSSSEPQQPKPPFHAAMASHGPKHLPEPSDSPGRNYYWDGRKWKRKKSWLEEIFD